MPIRPEFRRYYSAAWRRYRAELIAVRGSVCSVCGRKVTKYLNLSHTSHDPRTSEVRLLCNGCHNRYDSGHRIAIARRRRAKRYGQRWLWRDVELAPFPAWLRPGRRASRDEQDTLF
jgi:hypothetical protein